MTSQSHANPHYITALLLCMLATLLINTKMAQKDHADIQKKIHATTIQTSPPPFSPPLTHTQTRDDRNTTYIFKSFDLQKELTTIMTSLKNINQEIAHIQIHTQKKEIHVSLKHS